MAGPLNGLTEALGSVDSRDRAPLSLSQLSLRTSEALSRDRLSEKLYDEAPYKVQQADGWERSREKQARKLKLCHTSWYPLFCRVRDTKVISEA